MTARAKVVTVLALLVLGGLVLHAHDAASPPTDNVSHHDAVCQHFTWDASTARYITVNVIKGGGCK